MKILHLDTDETGEDGQSQILHLIKHLSDLGVENHLLAPEDAGLSTLLPDNKVEVTIHHHSLNGEWNVGAAWTLSSICSREEVDLIHAHDLHALGIYRFGSSFFSYPPLVLTRRPEQEMTENWFSQRSFPAVDHVLAVSSGVRDEMLDHGIASGKITLIPDGIDIDEITSTDPDPSILSEIGIDPDRTVIGNAGPLTKEKDQKTLVRAAARLIEDYPDTRFVIAGEGVLREEIERRIHDLNLEENVILAGRQQRIVEFLKTLDLFVLTSTSEGFSSVLLTAMACRVPVVATDVDNVPELIEHEQSGLLTSPSEPRNTATAIERFLNDDAPFDDFTDAAYERAKNYDHLELARRTKEVYSTLIEQTTG